MRDVRTLLAAKYDEVYLLSRAQTLGVNELLEEVLGSDE
jgi:hypothetical protein